MIIPPDLQSLIDDLSKRRASQIQLGDVEPLAQFADKLSDEDFIDFMTSLPIQLTSRIGRVSPSIVARIQSLVDQEGETFFVEDNRYERQYED